MRKALIVAALVAALGLPAAAVAAPPKKPTPYVLCGGTCTSGGGFTGCTNQTASHSANVWFTASINHFLVVRYCKVSGVITSVSILAHGCDTGGLVSCSPGPAWLASGGVGSRSATFEAHATWFITPLPIYHGTDVLTLTVPST
jgi:hypothetical protein